MSISRFCNSRINQAPHLTLIFIVNSVLEDRLSKHVTHPVLSRTYNPSLLSRTSRLSADISYLLGLPCDDDMAWKSHSMHASLIDSPPDALTAYTSHLAALSSHDPSLLLAHAYVRYLGDLSGGQIMKRKLRRAYGLEGDDNKGLTFYDFELDGEKVSVDEMRRTKEWFSDGIDKGVGDDRGAKCTFFEFRTITGPGEMRAH